MNFSTKSDKLAEWVILAIRGYKIQEKLKRAYIKLWALTHCRRFAEFGAGTTVHPGDFTFPTIHFGKGVRIDYGCRFWAVHSRIIVKEKTGIAAECVIMAGDHNTSCVGEYLMDFTEADKLPKNDRDIVIGEDVWVGTRCIILNGAKIGRGAVVGAGSVIRGVVPPYSIVAGNPARVLRFRADVAAIVAHETKLYLSEFRLNPALLEQHQKHYPNSYSTC